MYKNLKKEEKALIKLIPIIFVLGSLSHFLYEFTGNNKFVGYICPINESIWEHMKLALYPVFLCNSMYYLIRNKKNNIDTNKWFTANMVSVIVSMLSIPFCYYLYTGALGISNSIVNIFILLISISLGQILALHIYRRGRGTNAIFSISIVILIMILFALLTYNPLDYPIFKDIKS